MRNILLLPALLIIFTSANAQLSYLENWDDTPMNALVEYAKTYRPGLPTEYSGSFYLEEEFTQGVVLVEGEEKKLNVFLRYNALDDQVELKLKIDDDKVYLLPRMENIYYKTPNYSYVIKSFKTEDGKTVNGYMLKYFDGDEAKFFAKPMAHLQAEVSPRSGYDQYKPAHMSIKLFYYLSIGDKPFSEVKLNERQIRREMPNTPDLKRYFSNHKINTVEKVVELLKFYEE